MTIKLYSVVFIFTCLLTFVPKSVKSLPSGLPSRECSTISRPEPGDLCYVKRTKLGVRAYAHDGGVKRGEVIIQPIRDNYELVEVRVDNRKGVGNGTYSESVTARGGSVSVTKTYEDTIQELDRTINELEGQVNGLAGPVAFEAKNTLTYLKEKRREFNSNYQMAISASRNAPTYTFSFSASSRSCGTFGLDTCGSSIWIDLYEVRRYLGDPSAIAQESRQVQQQAQLALTSTPPETTYSLICIKNATNIDLPYRGKWSTDSGWFDVTLKSGESWRHWRENSNATMSIKFDSDARNGQVDTKTYTLQANISNDTKCSSGKPYRYKYTNSSREYIDLYKD